LAIHVFAWFTPGPLFVLIIRNSLVYSRKSGIWTAAGIAIGNFIHITYSVLGLALIISASPVAFNVIKFLGAGYLVYLGTKTFLTKLETQSGIAYHKHKDISPFEAAKTGFLTNILSPQASFFFASIFTTVMASGSPFWVVLFLWIAMPLNSFLMASILSIFFTQKRVRNVYANYQHIANRLLGAALFLLAGIVLLYK
jgi:threonine/homoserine/homoserine lactone efflux protein